MRGRRRRGKKGCHHNTGRGVPPPPACSSASLPSWRKVACLSELGRMRREGEEEDGVKEGEEGEGEEEEEGAGREDGGAKREDSGSREGLWTMWRSREVKALVPVGWMLQAWL